MIYAGLTMAAMARDNTSHTEYYGYHEKTIFLLFLLTIMLMASLCYSAGALLRVIRAMAGNFKANKIISIVFPILVCLLIVSITMV